MKIKNLFKIGQNGKLLKAWEVMEKLFLWYSFCSHFQISLGLN